MASQHMSNADFFTKLTDLFHSQQGKDYHNSVFLSQKRLSYDLEAPSSPATTKPTRDDFSDLNPSNPLPLIVRATDGNRKKGEKPKVELSTVVQPEELEAFFLRYADVCKAGMSYLKKRDRKGRKAKKRKGAAAAMGGDKS